MCYGLQFMQDRVNAMRDYQTALQLDPTYALAYFNAANVYFHTRHFRQVCFYFHIWQFSKSNFFSWIQWYLAWNILGTCNSKFIQMKCN